MDSLTSSFNALKRRISLHARRLSRQDVSSMVKARSNFTVVIIGGGATGLLIAQGLKKAGIAFRIFERYDATAKGARRPRDWSMGLHWGREYLQSLLPDALLDDLHLVSTDCWAELLSREEYEWACDPFQLSSFPVVNGQAGDVVGWVKATTSRRASRRKIIDLFARDLPIEYGKQLARLQDGADGVVCEFTDGTRVTADAVIGADSVRSVVRSQVMSESANTLETLPTIMWNFTQQYTAAQAKFIRKHYHPVFKYAVHPTSNVAYILSVLDVPDPQDPESWTFQLMIDQWGRVQHHETSEQRLAQLKSLAQDFCEPFRSAVLWVKDDTFIPADRPQHMPDLQPWDNQGGRISLAGDAAHPMAPYRAQGLNQGIRDAKEYVDAIRRVVAGEESLSHAISVYDEAVFRRGKEEIRLSAHQGVCSHHWDQLLESPLMQKGMHRLDQTHPVAPCPTVSGSNGSLTVAS